VPFFSKLRPALCNGISTISTLSVLFITKYFAWSKAYTSLFFSSKVKLPAINWSLGLILAPPG
jgi:hypothetical protein